MRHRMCVECGERIPGAPYGSKSPLYCSVTCKKAAKHLREAPDRATGRAASWNLRQAALRGRVCLHCGEPLTLVGRTGPLPVYCSAACRARAKDLRKVTECVECGARFSGPESRCSACRRVERQCRDCGTTIVVAANSRTRLCEPCRAAAARKTTARRCVDCGRVFRARAMRCHACRAKERVCEGCGKAFKGNGLRCPACYQQDRVCVDCGQPFLGERFRCNPCYRTAMDPVKRAAYYRSDSNARRVRRLAGAGRGYVSPAAYARILAAGWCVYCYGHASVVDHVWPLSRGGPEAETNLAPACAPCNGSKGAKLLTEWDPLRVLLALEVSPAVAAEWARLTALTAA